MKTNLSIFLLLLSLLSISCSSTNKFYDIPSEIDVNYYQEYIIKNAPKDNALTAFKLLVSYYQKKNDFTSMITTYNRFKVLFETRNPNFIDITELLQKNNYRFIITQDDISPKTLEILPRKEIPEEGARLFFDHNFVDSCFTNDSTVVLFCSDGNNVIGKNKPLHYNYDNYSWGNTDIFLSYKKKDGTWSEPINLGQRINTKYAERTPFLSPDKQTLYFASDRPDGFGGFDIYFSKRLSKKTWTEWSKPENLEKYINTANDELLIKLLDKNSFIFASNVDFDNKNLFKSYKAQFIPIIKFVGSVVDSINRPLYAKITYSNNDSLNQDKGGVYSDDISGKFILKLNSGDKYILNINCDRYISQTDNLDFTNIKDSLTINKKYVLKAIPPKQKKTLKDTIIIKQVDSIFIKQPITVIDTSTNKQQVSSDSIPILDFDDFVFVKWNILSNKIKYIVQVSAWDNPDKAIKVAKSIKQKGYPVVIRKALLTKYKKLFYRVQIDIIFNSLKEAQEYSKKHYKNLYDNYTINKQMLR